jgi:hypothetical protein
MKKIWYLCASVALALPLIAGAATWTITSDPFAVTAVRYNKISNPAQSILKYKPGASRGIVTFQYSLPEGTKNAKLTIYSLSGVRVESLDLAAGSSSVTWNFSKRKVGAGIYLASMRFGSFENKIQISIVK